MTEGRWFARSIEDEAHIGNSTIIGIGVLLLIAGCLAIWNTFAATMATVYVLGAYLVVGGVMNTIEAFTIHKLNLAILDVLGALLYFVAAWFTMSRPISAAVTITMVLAVLFMVSGAMRVIGAVFMRPPHWGYLAASGVISFLLGSAFIVGMPLTGLQGPGLLVGVDLLTTGIATTSLGISLRWVASSDDGKRVSISGRERPV